MKNQKPMYYDGSVAPKGKVGAIKENKNFIITDEARKQISGNPFVLK